MSLKQRSFTDITFFEKKVETFVAWRPKEVRAKEATTSQSLSHSNTLKLSVWDLDFDRQIRVGAEEEDEEEEMKLRLTLFLFPTEFLLRSRAQLQNVIDKACILFSPFDFREESIYNKWGIYNLFIYIFKIK